MMDSHVTTKDSKWPPRDAKQPQSRFWGETKGQKEVICHLNRQRQPQRDMEGTQRFKKTLKRMKMVRQRLKTAGDSKTSENDTKWQQTRATRRQNTKTTMKRYERTTTRLWNVTSHTNEMTKKDAKSKQSYKQITKRWKNEVGHRNKKISQPWKDIKGPKRDS